VLESARRRLRDAGVDEASLRAEWLISHHLRIPRLELPLHGSRVASAAEEAQIQESLQRLAMQEPLQYVVGEADFRGAVLTVDRRALIPRPETEQLVERVLADEALSRAACPRLADVGTGSGCIAIALVLAMPRAQVTATDISADALSLAVQNARRHGVWERIRFHLGSVLDGVEDESLDAVVSNPPYIRSTDYNSLPASIREFEPRQALEAGEDGLDVIRLLARDSRRTLKSGGSLYLEIGAGQGNAVRQLLSAAGFRSVRVEPDLAGLERFALGIRA